MFLAWFVLASALAAEAPNRAAMASFRESIARTLASLETAVSRPGSQPSIRDLPNGALTRLLLGQDPAGAERLLRFAFEQQQPDGTVPWQIGRPEIKDANAIEFTMQPVGPILKGYGAKLSPEFKAWLRPRVSAAFTAMRHHKVPVSYTNIFLMKTVNLVLAGEAVGDAEAAAEGYAQLDAWIAYTRDAGIHEFNSPTYYCTDLNSLVGAWRYMDRAEGREKVRRILDYFWTDIAANFFEGRQRMSGPHSRDYDFLTGHGGIDMYLAAAGWRERPYTDRVDLEKVYVLLNDFPGGYQPAASLRKLAATPHRTVIQTWGLEPDNVRTHYVTPQYSIGSTSADYNPQDKLISVELASRDDIPAITVVPDPFDAPYGKVRMNDRSGHSKPWHAPLHLTSVQQDGVILALLDIDPSTARAAGSFSTSVILPAAADVFKLDGRTVSLAKPAAYPAGAESVVGLKLGGAAVAMRIFRAEAFEPDFKPSFALQSDAAGLKLGAARYTVYQYQGSQTVFGNKHAFVGLLIAAGTELDPLMRKLREARLEDSSDGAEWKVAAHLGSLHLEAARSIEKRKTVLRRVNGEDAPRARFTVDDRDYSAVLEGRP
jgi:hypothetical protein